MSLRKWQRLRNEILQYRRLRDLREDHNLSQQKLAEFLGVSQNTYSRYETSARGIPLDLISKLADYYKTSVDYLLGRTDVSTPYPRSKSNL